MPALFIEIPDHASTIRRASMLSLVINVAEQLGLEKDYIQFKDVYDNKAQPNSTIGHSNDVKFGSEERITVEMEEQRDNFNLVDRGLGYQFQVPIFHDSFHGIRVTPAHARHNVTANLSARFTSRGLASSWLNTMHRRTAMFGDIFEVESTFHYVIPSEVITILKMMYYTGAKKVTPTQTLEEYLRENFHPNVTIATTDTGSSSTWMVRNTLGRIVVIMDGLGEITTDKESESGAFEAKITYTYQIDWPEGLKLDYPCMVNNSAIPERIWHCRELPGTVNIDSYEKSELLYAQDRNTTHSESVALPIVIPPIGYPMLSTSLRTTSEYELVIVFMEFGNTLPDPTPPEELASTTDKFLLNLKDLGDVTFKPSTIKYLTDSYSTDPFGADSLFKLTTYAYTSPLAKKTRVDADLNVWLVDTEIDLTEEYRFAITLETNLIYLSDIGRLHLKDNLEWLLEFIRDFYPSCIYDYPWLFPGIDPKDIFGNQYPPMTGGSPPLAWSPDGVNSGGQYPSGWSPDGVNGSGQYPWGWLPNNPFWPTDPIWNPVNAGKPVWPDDFFDWWFEDGLILEHPSQLPDGGWDVLFNPDHPLWDYIMDGLGTAATQRLANVNIHISSIIAQRG